MHSQHLIKNRILRQLSADELKSVQPWLTLVQLKSNVVLHEPGGAVRWSVPPFTTEVECKMPFVRLSERICFFTHLRIRVPQSET